MSQRSKNLTSEVFVSVAGRCYIEQPNFCRKVAIAHEGGPVRGFSNLMPAFGGMLSLEEIKQAFLYIKAFCTNKSWPKGELNLPRPLYTEKAFPEDELVFSVDTDKNRDAVAGKIVTSLWSVL